MPTFTGEFFAAGHAFAFCWYIARGAMVHHQFFTFERACIRFTHVIAPLSLSIVTWSIVVPTTILVVSPLLRSETI